MNSHNLSKLLLKPKRDTASSPKFRVAPPKLTWSHYFLSLLWISYWILQNPKMRGWFPGRTMFLTIQVISGDFELEKALGSEMLLQTEKLF